MAFSWQEQVKPAGTQDIQCDIEYLDKSYIHVYLDGAETTAFTWTSSTNIRLNSPLSAETVVLLIRKTEREYLYIEFASGAPFIEVNVDSQNKQFLHLAQELVEGRAIPGFYGNISMNGYRITNLEDPQDAQDAATKSYVDGLHDAEVARADAQFARTIRVPESSVSLLPPAADRSWTSLGFDGSGQPVVQDPAGTGLWGYVPAIDSFEKGSLLTQRFEVLLWESTEEYWRWDGALPKTVLPGSTPDTAGGRGKGKWLDVTDATLRANLGSSEIPGAGIVMLGQAVTVQQAMDYILNKGNAVRLSTYCLLSATENSAFAAALEGAKSADGYVRRVIVNDTGRPIKLTERFLFQSVESTSVLGGTYNNNLCGVVGEFELANGAGFDFISCYSPFINIVVTDGGGNSVDAATPLNSDFAVRMERGVIAPEFHITGYEYEGYLFGSTGSWNGVAASGVQCVHKSSLAAFGGAAALYVRGTTGFGNITSVWEEGVTHYSLIDTAYDVQIASYENFIPAAGAGQLTLRACGSMHIGKLLTGAWGVPQVKIFDCPSVDIGTHLSVLGNSDVNTEDTYAADICGSVVHIGSSQLLKLGCGYRVGHGASLTIDNINGNILNQAVNQTNDTSYDGASTSTASSVTIKSARLFRGNSSLVLSSKDMFHVDATITSGKLELQSVEAIGFNYQRTSNYARLVNVLSQSANFKVYLDGVSVDYTGTTLPFYIYNYASLLKSIGLFFTGELQFSSGNSSGNGKVLEVSSGLNTGGGTTTYTGNKKLRVYIVGTILTGGGFSVVRSGKTVFLSSTVGQFAANFDVRPGDVLVVSNSNTTISSSWAEVQFN